MIELYEDPCVKVTLDAATGIISFTRSEVPYPSLSEFLAIHTQVGRALDRAGRDKHALLVDMRRTAMNNDPEFERASARARSILVRGFPRVAVLVATAVGALQVKRHVREDGLDIGVFSRERDAIDFLLGVIEGEETPKSGVGVTSDGPFKALARRAGRK